jgi:hypothetical protein
MESQVEEKKRFPRATFRLAELEEEIAARSEPQTERRYAQIARRDLGRLYALYAQSLPTFSLPEAQAIFAAQSGTAGRVETAHLLWAEVDAYLAEHPQAEVRRARLVERLRGLSRFECMAVIDAIERAWVGPYRVEDVAGRLRAVGLVRDE